MKIWTLPDNNSSRNFLILIPALLAAMLFVPLFAIRSIGFFDFWWWMSTNIIVLLLIIPQFQLPYLKIVMDGFFG